MSKPTLQDYLDNLAARIRQAWAADLPVEGYGHISSGDTQAYLADSGSGYDDPLKVKHSELNKDLEGWIGLS